MSEPFEIFVYCDDPSHRPKREPIETFAAMPSGGWGSRLRKMRQGRAGHGGTGMTMVGDTLPSAGWANDSAVSNADLRERYELACERTPQCRRRPVPARREHLFPVLDRWRDLGASELPLSVLAAMLDEQAKRRSLG